VKVWTNTKFHGHWPVGTAAVVVAETAEQAADLLRPALAARGLHGPVTPDQFVLVPVDQPLAVVLLYGDY
jgi:hypothetical protein